MHRRRSGDRPHRQIASIACRCCLKNREKKKMSQDELIYDWNLVLNRGKKIPHAVELCDETLRDGIQSPSISDPKIDHKLQLISLMDELGITIADIGLPGAGPRAYADVLHIARFVRDRHL